jgi:Ca-activated chloride channel family protein
LLVFVPVLLASYQALQGRRRAVATELGSMRLADAASGRRIGRRRHIPFLLFAAAITLLIVSLARPEMVIALPKREGTVILAFDVSSSMIAGDLQPSRLEAAKTAASGFVDEQPSSIQIGVVAFAASALVVQRPTNVKADVLAAIDRLSPQGGTSLADGILTSLGAVAGKPIVLDPAAIEAGLESVDIGYFGSAVIVVLSDGENTSRLDPLVVSQLAANAGVRVYSIGIGSADGATVEIDGYMVATALNEALLEEMAAQTGGKYFHAEDEEQLSGIYGSIDLKLSVRGEETEVTAIFAAAALLLLLVGGGLTMLWFGRVP